MTPLCSPDRTRLGWIGTGVMGSSMCGHLLAAGYSITVHNRTKVKSEEVLKKGATWADSPRVVAEQADIIFSIVGYPRDVEEVVFGPQGTLAGCRPGSVLVDMTTSCPSLAAHIAEEATSHQVVCIDAPVSGGDIGARNATLSIMIGGDRETVESLAPCWQAMGKTWIWQGGPGAGQHAKMVNQTLIATNMIGVCEALLYGYRAGLDLDKVMQSVVLGAAGSWSLSNLGPRIIADNFDPGFFVEHFIKDLDIALAEAERMELRLPGLQLARELYCRLAERGHSRDGTHALILTLAEMSGIDWRNR